MKTNNEGAGQALHLQCSKEECDRQYPIREVHTVCPHCGSILLVYYDLDEISRRVSKRRLGSRSPVMWRYLPWLPFSDRQQIVSLGEPVTPLLSLDVIGADIGLKNLIAKDESRLPGGSFKARGMAVAVSRARVLGLTRLAVPTAGNAGVALGLYAAAAGVESHIVMPEDAMILLKEAARSAATSFTTVDGLISDCVQVVREGVQDHGWFDLSTTREPYRLEGKKTMGLELMEQLNWKPPAVIVYPTGGGTGLLGIAKALDELLEMGWIPDEMPRFVAVQAESCSPVVKAFEKGSRSTEPFIGAATYADGLRVPDPFAGELILSVLDESKGLAISVSDQEIEQARLELAGREGVLVGPEAAATLAGCRRLVTDGQVDSDEKIVLMLTGGYQGRSRDPLPPVASESE